MTLSITMFCHYAECHLLNVVILNVVVPSVVAPFKLFIFVLFKDFMSLHFQIIFLSVFLFISLSLCMSVCLYVWLPIICNFFYLFIIPLYTLLQHFLFTFLLRSIFLSPLSLMLFLLSLSAPVSPFLFLSFSLFLSFFPFLSFFSFSHSHFTIFSFCLSLSLARSRSLSFISKYPSFSLHN